MTTAREIQTELKPAGRRLRAAIPQVYAGYAALSAAAMGVVILMNGGPGTVWAPRAYAAFEEFAGPGGVSPRGS